VFGSEEARLLTRAQRGDLNAFEALVRSHQQRVYAHSYHLLGNAAEAEDVSAETFLRAYQHLADLRADPSIVHWLLRVAGNLCVSMLRKRTTRPTVELEEIGELSSSAPSPEEVAITHSRQDVVRHCLEALGPKERTAVLMFYLEDRPLEEIARVLGCGVAGAKSRVHRARHRLRGLVMEELGEDVLLPKGKEGDTHDTSR
jgi:RNA polymerase sigma-70 factor, ECF subfamily